MTARAGRHQVVRPADPLAELHRDHYRDLVRLANLLLGDLARSEEIVQDAFVKLQLRWGGLRQIDRAPAYLRSVVLNGARSALRHGKVVDRYDSRRRVSPAPASPEATAVANAEHDRIIAAMRQLPDRQRDALALRYYLELSQAEIAQAMGISNGSVKTHLHRALANLAALLTEDDRGEDGR